MISFVFILSLLITWIASAFFCASVAEAKGYKYSSWFIAGFFFGFFGLIASAGLPDKKLRKYILQIALKQEAINMGNLDAEEGEDFEKEQDIRFLISEDSKENDIYNKLLSCIEDIAVKEEMIRRVESTEIKKRGFRGIEFVCKDKEDNYLLTLRGNKVKDNQIEWIGNLIYG